MTVCPECQGSGIVSCCDTAGASATAGKFDEGAFKRLAEEMAKSSDSVDSGMGARLLRVAQDVGSHVEAWKLCGGTISGLEVIPEKITIN